MEAWFLQQLAEPPSLHLEDVLAKFPPDGRFYDEQGNTLPEIVYAASDSFWEKAISADDQLRQRMAYALSQIMVISAQGNLTRVPQTVAAYMDVLTRDAFGNFRDLMEDVTYSPAMAVYLTYLRNEKADPKSGRVPDENYARELLQLFTVGLVELQPDGEPVTGKDEKAVELFDNKDITNLAKVFTGLSFAGAAYNTPLERFRLTLSTSPCKCSTNTTQSRRRIFWAPRSRPTPAEGEYRAGAGHDFPAPKRRAVYCQAINPTLYHKQSVARLHQPGSGRFQYGHLCVALGITDRLRYAGRPGGHTGGRPVRPAGQGQTATPRTRSPVNCASPSSALPTGRAPLRSTAPRPATNACYGTPAVRNRWGNIPIARPRCSIFIAPATSPRERKPGRPN